MNEIGLFSATLMGDYKEAAVALLSAENKISC